MTDELKSFIVDNSELINTAQWDEVYSKLYVNNLETDIGEFTTALLEIGIDPGKTMKKLPVCFLSRSDIPYYTIGKNVTELDKFSFYLSNIESVIIPDNVVKLGPDCFYSCLRLRKLSIGEGIDTIPYKCFYLCRSLQSVTIPDTVHTIHESAFAKNIALEYVELGGRLKYIAASAFDDCVNLKTIKYNGTISMWQHVKIFGKPFLTDNNSWRHIECIDGVI